MYLKRTVAPSIIWFFSWRTLATAFILGTTVTLVYQIARVQQIGIPFLPIATIGTAVAFYVGFKNNSSYDRVWEGRKIWGELTNVSRTFASYLLAVVPPDSLNSARAAVLTQIAYVNLVRVQLRKANMWDNGHLYTHMIALCFPTRPYEEEALELLQTYCPTLDAATVLAKKNPAKEVLHHLMRQVSSLRAKGALSEFHESDLLRICGHMFDAQGKAERIKTFPFPRQYAYFSEIFIRIFILLLPFGLVQEFSKLGTNTVWLTIPFTMLIAWIFDTMEKVGDTSENPFENGLNDVPMTAICRNIEIDLKELLGDADFPCPAPVSPVKDILM